MTDAGRAQIVNTGQAYLNEGTEYAAVAGFNNVGGAVFYNNGDAYFYGDFHNDGRFDFIEDTGTSHFAGTDEQVLAGGNTSYFSVVHFNNNSRPEPFMLKGDFYVEGHANFDQGIINNRDFGGRFIFGDRAFSLNTSDEGHINGPVEKTGDRSFSFPIGHEGFYRQAEIGSASHNRIGATYYHENSEFYYPHTAKSEAILDIDNREYWTVEKAANPGIRQMITLSWSRETTPERFIRAAKDENLIITRWDVEEKQWVYEKSSIDGREKTVSAVVKNFGVFTLARAKEKGMVDEACSLEIFNVIDINGSGQNKRLRIESAANCAKIEKVMVFNRWGIKVFETDDYGPDGDVFDGYSGGRWTITRNTGLPTGTYFYVINYKAGDSTEQGTIQKQGYLYIKN